MADLESVDRVADKFDNFVTQACNRVFSIKQCKYKNHVKRAKYFDNDCSLSRIDAIKAGERVTSESDRLKHRIACKKYNALKQRKKRSFQAKSREEVNKAFKRNPADVWGTIDSLQLGKASANEPSGDDFFKHFQDLSKPSEVNNFNDSYEEMAKDFLKRFGQTAHECKSNENEILNSNFTIDEVDFAIGQLKNGRSPGADFLPPEFIKYLKNDIKCDLTELFNYIIENRKFPKKWADGIKSAIYKNGDRLNPSNYRGITVPRIFEKIFEQVIMNRLQFVNEAFNRVDQTNGGFLKGRRTSDNIFILNGLIQKQLSLGKKLYICFVDFSKAFDLISRYILFYKIMKGGWHGRVVDTLKDLYDKTQFRVKSKGKLSPFIENTQGVNQGGIASGFLFRKYMSDLSDYLKTEFGVPICEEILTHILWADDLVLISDSLAGIRKQLDGLNKFCKDNRMLINEIKTKIMVFGSQEKVEILFNDLKIKQTQQYKFLGAIFSAVHKVGSDPFKLNYDYLSDQARKSMFAIKQKLKSIGYLPPKTMFYLYNSALKPIIIYASDVWGVHKAGRETADKFFLKFAKQILGVRQTTTNIFAMGESGQILPSISCVYNVLTYFNRVHNMSNDLLVKQVFDELCRLHKCGFHNWYSDALKMMELYNLDVNSNHGIFKIVAKLSVEHGFKNDWLCKIRDTVNNPGARTYKLFKHSYNMEPYLYHVDNYKHRRSLTKLRTSTHTLKIETDRHKKDKPDVIDRKCHHCNITEDEVHFMISCPLYFTERTTLFHNLGIDHLLGQYSPVDVFICIINMTNQCHLKEIARYVHVCFEKRKKILEQL